MVFPSPQLVVLREQDSQLQNSKILLQNVEREKKQLEKKVMEIQMTLANSQSNDKVEGSESKKIQEDKEALEVQIEFLNSVIVDVQRKNDELKSKLKILETGEIQDDGDLNLNGIKAVIPPRLFCDICDIFDLHDTEDCPQQVMEEVSHSQHHGERHQERPYCENCEVFGHWQRECD
ncbi:CAP-Gly domain-containing linker protein 1-like, partial [Limulus polyphemus]|uniref:CAP-Gly domain-containing linker protein 1-like n=1 Tax=Limulus polyphemus TaxID=6850 RepID=A0ABM1BWT2_LIMPO